MTNLLSESELRLLFWDTDYTPIDYRKHSKAVIERILMFGSMDAYRWLFRLFERKFFLEHRKDLNQVAFVPSLWKRLTAEDREESRSHSQVKNKLTII